MRRPPLVFGLSALIAVTVAIPAGGTAPQPGNVADPGPVYIAKLRVHVRTTSDWTEVSFSQGSIASSAMRASSGPGTWTAQGSAISLSDAGATGTKSATEDLLYLDITQQPIVLVVTKGQIGTTEVKISNLDTGATVSQLTDQKHTGSRETYPVSVEVPRSKLIGARSAPIPRADPRKLVLAFYYPWYTTYHNSGLEERPRGPRSTFSRSGVSSMTAQARANGIDGFIVSWAGAQADGKPFRLALHAAARQHQMVTGYLESLIIAQGHLFEAEQRELTALTQLLRYRNEPGFLHTPSGRPVVFVYAMNRLEVWQWRDLLSRLHNQYGEQVALVGDDASAGYRQFEWGVHRYGALLPPAQLRDYSLSTSLSVKAQAALHPSARRKLFAASVSPGFDDRRLHRKSALVIPRANGRRYKQTWRAAVAGQPDWILITSWNEWFEDTAIEPGSRSGRQALAITRREVSAWKHN